MRKFKVGDRVRRIYDEWLGMKPGDIGTVTAVDEDGDDIGIAEYATNEHSRHLSRNFELVAAASNPEPPAMVLSEDPVTRKNTPITSGVLDYFPRALAAVAQCSKAGNDQHNPGQPLHWAKGKSTDHADCIARHLIDRHAIDTDGIPHMSKLAWRALALLETELEKQAGITYADKA